jgi:hypothetical protein
LTGFTTAFSLGNTRCSTMDCIIPLSGSVFSVFASVASWEAAVLLQHGLRESITTSSLEISCYSITAYLSPNFGSIFLYWPPFHHGRPSFLFDHSSCLLSRRPSSLGRFWTFLALL